MIPTPHIQRCIDTAKAWGSREKAAIELRALQRLKDDEKKLSKREAFKEQREMKKNLTEHIAKLKRYVRHELNCESVLPQDPRFKHLRGACTCGLEALL